MAQPRRPSTRKPPPPGRAPIGARVNLRLPPDLVEQLEHFRRLYYQPELGAMIRLILGQWVDGERIRRGSLYAQLPSVMQRELERLEASRR